MFDALKRWFERLHEASPEPTSDKQRLEELLYRLADEFGSEEEFWARKVRACADRVRAGDARGLRDFLSLFGGMGSINDQQFSHVLSDDLSSAYSLAKELLREHDREMSGLGPG